MRRSYLWVPVALFALFVTYERTWAGREVGRKAAMDQRIGSVRLDDPYAGRDGRAEAEADLACGNPKWKVYGLRDMAGDERWRRILRERFGVEQVAIAGCVVSTALLEYARDYNDAVRREIIRRHGEEAFTRACEDASQ